MSLDRSALVPLSSVLGSVDELDWRGDQLYVEQPRDRWEPATRCSIVAVDPYEEEPDTIVVEGVELRRALAGFQVREIVRNLRSGGEPSPERFVEGLKYFHEFDGFLDG